MEGSYPLSRAASPLHTCHNLADNITKVGQPPFTDRTGGTILWLLSNICVLTRELRSKPCLKLIPLSIRSPKRSVLIKPPFHVRSGISGVSITSKLWAFQTAAQRGKTATSMMSVPVIHIYAGTNPVPTAIKNDATITARNSKSIIVLYWTSLPMSVMYAKNVNAAHIANRCIGLIRHPNEAAICIAGRKKTTALRLAAMLFWWR